jgi:hypothetical protein
MFDELNHPLLVFAASLVALWLAARFGYSVLRTRRGLTEDAREEFGTILAATLTLLGLIIGFSFSMAITRYDLRKTYEEAEANAIGTEIARAGLLPAADAQKVRGLLRDYVALRMAFYMTQDRQALQDVNSRTAKLQEELWSAVQGPALAQPNPVVALAVSGMNDVLNSQGYTQAAWWNRIPHAAWGLMILIALCCNVLVGYGARDTQGKGFLLLVLPLVLSIAFLLIADIDSPRGGLIHVYPQNLASLLGSLSGK